MTAPLTVNTDTRPTVLSKTVRRDLARDVVREVEVHLLAAAGAEAGR